MNIGHVAITVCVGIVFPILLVPSLILAVCMLVSIYRASYRGDGVQTERIERNVWSKAPERLPSRAPERIV